MLILSQESQKLIKTDRAGNVLAMFSLAGIVNAEGVTMDRDGNIYIVDDNDATSQPRLLVLSAVPLPGAAWLLGSGLIGDVGAQEARN